MNKELKPIEGEVVEKKDKELTVQSENKFIPSFPTKSQITEYKSFLANYNDFIDSQLSKDIDYGVIPGVEKPSLLKPGAEKLEKLYFYRHEKVLVDKIVRDDYISYTYRTIIYNKNGEIVATCEGTCNSHEKKYRYRSIPEWEAGEEIKRTIKPEVRKAKSGKSYAWYKIENTEVADLENTIMKMAQKRSYVGAILEATNSSGRFTQDVEDMPEFAPKAPQKTVQAADDIPVIEYGEYGEPIEPFPSKNPNRVTSKVLGDICQECKANPISEAEKKYSLDKYGFEMCRKCQLKFKPQK